MGSLIEFICPNPKCGKKIVWAQEKAEVLCNGCYKWIKAKDLKNPNPNKISDSDNPEQLRMF